MTLSLLTKESQYNSILQIILKNEITDYKILHHIPGRLRISIPKLTNDEVYAKQLENRLQSFNFVTEVRINPKAGSIVINYNTDFNQEKSILDQIQTIDLSVLSLTELPKLEINLLTNGIKTLLNGTVKNIAPTVGKISLALGILGVILPLIPGTPFLLLSSFCFSLADEEKN